MQSWADFYREPVNLNFHIRNLYNHLPLFDALVESAPKRVLEVGVGTGGMSLFLASLGFEVIAVDNDQVVLDAAASAGSAVRTLHHALVDAFDLTSSFGAREFDVAFSQGFFEHFNDEEIRTLVAQQLAVSRRVVFSVPSAFYPSQDFGNERLLEGDQWRDILSPFGRVKVEYYGMGLDRNGEPRPMHVLAAVDAAP